MNYNSLPFAVMLATALWPSTPVPVESPEAPLGFCAQESFHPLELKVKLQENLRPGAWLQAEITVESRVDLREASVVLRPTPGVEIVGDSIRTVGTLDAGVVSTLPLQLRVPDQREPLQVQAELRGDHEGQLLQKGATLHLLPRGPHHPAVTSPVASKSRGVLEYPGAARRMR